MTHDELLAKIDYSTPSQLKAITLYAALRAVVELHEPRYMGCGEDNCCGPDMCECGDTLPCPTIQAIEKELK
jgi:hypothetical protein